jgi:hypothetical protein
MTSIGATEDHSVLSFLQLAVVVDDLALDGVATVPSSVQTPDELLIAEPETAQQGQPQDNDASDGAGDLLAEEAESTRLRTGALTEAFADLGVGCAVLAPDDAGEVTRARVQGLAARADILILDWVLEPLARSEDSGPDHDRTSRQLVAELLEFDSQLGGRLRLLCIYTGNPGVESIMDQLFDLMKAHAEHNPFFGEVRRDDGLRTISAAHVSILVLLKPTNPRHRTESTVSEEDLPRLLVSAFLQLSGDGLLPRLALAAVAAVRAHTHRMLARFPADLDPPFLSNRAITSPYDGEHFALHLIGDELASLMVASRVDESINQARVASRLQALLPASVPSRIVKGAGPAAITMDRQDAVRLLELGHEAAAPITLSTGKQWKNSGPSVTSLMVDPSSSPEAEGLRMDERFGVLSSLSRSPEHEGPLLTPPVLTLGSILRSRPLGARMPWSYWVCLQPSCDSVRLDVGTSIEFPLYPLTLNPAGGGCVVLAHEPSSGSVVHLALAKNTYLGKQSVVDVRGYPFEAGGNRVVEATWRGRPVGWHFMSNGRAFRWLGDMRLEQAQRLVGDIAQTLARRGLDEAEYSRLHKH